ncbi:MAG: DnaD domain protein [Clostridium sp.]|nr:DnaD domain protein [Acetatifactor muris]MCM1525865.1 DnaD domain protein [Bacteroides sp.]MCM1562595.1 DnaD domain protein [Clostridium sp.]
MARLKIYKDSNCNSTAISNRFIDEYMDGANEAQLKVYLYLLRMLGADRATSVSDLADKFNHTEREIIRSLKYWEKKQLLTMDYDAAGIPTGIHFRDLEAETDAGHSSTSRSLAVFMENGSKPEGQAVDTAPAPSYGQVPDTAPALSYGQVPNAGSALSYGQVPNAGSASPYGKPSYSAEQLREFKSRQETARLLFIAESYIGRPLTPAEMKSILFFTDVLHFSEDLIDYLIAYCMDRGKKDFKYMEKVAVSWAENGVTTPAEARKHASKYDKNVYAIMNALGKNNVPTAKEAEYITRWTGEYGFDLDIILEACERTVLATDRHRLEYAESILSSWRQENVHHKADIHKIDELYHRRKSGAKPSTNNKFNQFSQNSYDFDALEKELLRN